MLLQKINMIRLKLSSSIISSYWFIPLMMSFAAILLSFLAISFDHWIGTRWVINFSWIINNQPEGARAVLTIIAGSMITVAGVTFSMTLVAVSFALGQIGPRLIQNFMRDIANQFTLGTFVATFLYCLVILRAVLNVSDNSDVTSFVPQISIFIAMILAISSIGVLIFFIHHIQNSINISKILAKIGVELSQQLEQQSTYEGISDSKDDENLKIIIPINFHKSSACIVSKINGYVRNIDIKAIMKLAIEKDCIIEIKAQPGMFVSQSSPLLYVDKVLENDDKNICLNSFNIRHERDKGQDIYFLSDEITEIIARALSPGVNDPFTAIAAINWLRCAMEVLSRKKIKSPYLCDENNNLRVIINTVSLQQFVNKVFGQIRAYVSKDTNVSLHTMLVIKEMIQNNTDPTLKNVLQLHADYLHAEAIENLKSKHDKDLISAYAAEIRILSQNHL